MYLILLLKLLISHQQVNVKSESISVNNKKFKSVKLTFIQTKLGKNLELYFQELNSKDLQIMLLGSQLKLLILKFKEDGTKLL